MSILDSLLIIFNTVLENNGKAQLNELKGDMDLRDDIGFDSLALAEITVRIESKYGIDIFDESIVTNVDEIIQRLNSNEK
jgi:acyl carrier protein